MLLNLLLSRLRSKKEAEGMWTYSQLSGDLANPSGDYIGSGYSGRGAGLNNSLLQDDPDIGPIPQGTWLIGTFFDDPGGKGPIVCHLSPASTTQTFGRSGFMIHGDNKESNHTASEGCIILARNLREAVAESKELYLLVTE
jgi:Protein of unknown function (DUF2778)